MFNGSVDNNITVNNSGLIDGSQNGLSDNYYSNQRDILTNGLVLYLDAANRTSAVNGSSTWRDLSNNQNNGTLVNSPAFNYLNKGNYSFNGTNNYVDLGNPASLNLSTLFTICAWVKFNILPTTGNLYGIYDKGDTVNNTQIFFRVYSQSTTLITLEIGTYRASPLYISAATYNLLGNTIFNVNKWNYLVGYYNGSEFGLSINGLLLARTPNTTIISSTFGTLIGASYSSPNNVRYLNGSIGMLKAYNIALSQQEIVYNYNATKTRFGL